MGGIDTYPSNEQGQTMATLGGNRLGRSNELVDGTIVGEVDARIV
ncbi:hypothetical protein THARTR1_07440 [Trichoderma harzianum]|uniref:Uncharacterized protein n=1 Tax=Trichoderma harzianum TaxID=5544 RepID=A0A2K0U376_TRIHA|nr:hypothetical protein THARTR1_07440 [Trichoderma harzianum]